MRSIILCAVLISGCNTYPTCPLPMESDRGRIVWDKEVGILEADAGGMDLFRNYIAARRVCGVGNGKSD